MANPSIMTDRFNSVPQIHAARSVFRRNHGHKTTCDAGWLVPIIADEILPGDTLKLKTYAVAQMTTPKTPFMDNIKMETFFFACPMRLLWTNFRRFMGEQANPGDSTSFTIPQMVSPSSPVGYIPPANWASPTTAELASALSDYLSLPTKIANMSHSSLWHRFYNFVWNEFFRAQDLQNSVTVDLGDGPDTYTNYKLLKRGKRHDYFTAALPYLSKFTLPTLTFAGYASVVTNSLTPTVTGGTVTNTKLRVSSSAQNPIKTTAAPAADADLVWGNETGMRADLSTATGQNMNQIRLAMLVTALYERDTRGGTRYPEQVMSQFGVVMPDTSYRPEFLGGGSSAVIVNPVQQTSGTGASGTTTPLGNLAGYAKGTVSGHGFAKSFTEHSLLLGLVNFRADITYQQGLHRMFSRSTRLDFYFPVLEGLGEQAVLNKEIYCDGSGNDNNVFGYVERGLEYKFKPSIVTGRFRSNDAATLHAWHLSPQFASLPVLGDAFIQDAPPIDRVVATPTEPDFLLDIYFEYECARPLPVFNIPAALGRF